MNQEKKMYYFFSGEGNHGHWESRYCTLPQAHRIANKLRANGDRWCSIWEEHSSLRDDWLVLYQIGTGEVRELSVYDITRA